MPKEPRDRQLRPSKVSKLSEIAKLAVIADLIDVDALRADPSLAPELFDAEFATFTPDEWEELQACMRVDHSMLTGTLRQHRKERLLRDPDTPRKRP
jgi:hypothetical protein